MMANTKVITLTTLYRPKAASDRPMIEVISYKNDPRGEEFFAEFNIFTELDFKKRFVNRLIYYSGEGGYLPFINCRVMFDITNRRMIYGGAFTPHPPSRDYKNPFVKKTDDEETVRRISVGSIETIFAPVGIRSFFETDISDLKSLFQTDPVPLGRRVRRERDEKERRDLDRKEFSRGGRDSTSERKRDESIGQRELDKSKDERKKTNEKSRERTSEKLNNDKPGESKNSGNPESEKFEKLLKKCNSLAIQSSALYPIDDFSIIKDVSIAEKMIDDALNSMSLDYIKEMKIENIGGIPAVVMSKDKKVVGYSTILPRKKGVLLDENLGLIVLESSSV